RPGGVGPGEGLRRAGQRPDARCAGPPCSRTASACGSRPAPARPCRRPGWPGPWPGWPRGAPGPTSPSPGPRRPRRCHPGRRPLSAPGLADWAARARGYPQTLVAVGVLRLARHFDEAGRLLARSETPAEWRDLHANEEAALAWHAGRAEEALALWQAQEQAVP